MLTENVKIGFDWTEPSKD